MAALAVARAARLPPHRARAGLFGTNLDKIWDESGAVNGLLRQLLRLPDTLEGLRGVLESRYWGDFSLVWVADSSDFV